MARRLRRVPAWHLSEAHYPCSWLVAGGAFNIGWYKLVRISEQAGTLVLRMRSRHWVMSEKHKFNDPDGTYFVTSTIVGWVDVFTRPEMKHIVIDSLRFCQREKGLQIHAWCLMPSHLHMIISTVGEPLEKIMCDFKKFTSREIIKSVDSVFESRKDWILALFGEVADHLARVKNYKVFAGWQSSGSIDKSKVHEAKDRLHTQQSCGCRDCG